MCPKHGRYRYARPGYHWCLTWDLNPENDAALEAAASANSASKAGLGYSHPDAPFNSHELSPVGLLLYRYE